MVQEAYPGSDMEGGMATRNSRMPQVKPCKDPQIEEDSIKKIMSLALYGAAMNAQQKGEDMFVANYETIQLFKNAGLIK
jgi:hypothetical protein